MMPIGGMIHTRDFYFYFFEFLFPTLLTAQQYYWYAHHYTALWYEPTPAAL